MYDEVIGSLLVASWVNAILFTLEVLQVVTYFRKCKDDPKALKALVGTCFGFDIISTVVNDIGVYRYTITNWGNVSFINEQQWQIPLYLYVTGLGAAMVQTFLARRYYLLSKHWVPLIPLFALILISLAGAFGTATILTYATNLSQRAMVRIPVVVWFAGSCIVDCSLAGLLIFELRSSRTRFRSTRSLVNRLSSIALQSGTYSSIVALAVLFFYLANPAANIATGFCQCLGRVYTLTLLHNLLIRQSMRDESRSASNNTGVVTTGGVETFALGGIRVQTDRIVMSDSDKSMAPVLDDEPAVKTDGDANMRNTKSYPLA